MTVYAPKLRARDHFGPGAKYTYHAVQQPHVSDGILRAATNRTLRTAGGREALGPFRFPLGSSDFGQFGSSVAHCLTFRWTSA